MHKKDTLTDKIIAGLINEEFQKKTLAVTSQYLDIHQPVFQNGEIKIERIDREDDNNNVVIAYLPVKDEHFYFAIYIDNEKEEVVGFGTESRNTVSLIATSENLKWREFSFLDKLHPSLVWNKGDLKNEKMGYNCSLIEYEPNPEPDEFEDKLRKLLALLTNEKENVKKIMSKADAYISVIMDFHAGNQLLGSAVLDKDCLQQATQLGLTIQFQFTAWGKPFN